MLHVVIEGSIFPALVSVNALERCNTLVCRVSFDTLVVYLSHLPPPPMAKTCSCGQWWREVNVCLDLRKEFTLAMNVPCDCSVQWLPARFLYSVCLFDTGLSEHGDRHCEFPVSNDCLPGSVFCVYNAGRHVLWISHVAVFQGLSATFLYSVFVTQDCLNKETSITTIDLPAFVRDAFYHSGCEATLLARSYDFKRYVKSV